MKPTRKPDTYARRARRLSMYARLRAEWYAARADQSHDAADAAGAPIFAPSPERARAYRLTHRAEAAYARAARILSTLTVTNAMP